MIRYVHMIQQSAHKLSQEVETILLYFANIFAVLSAKLDRENEKNF